jgi:putative acetyltransferase
MPIRNEIPGDRAAVHALNATAFETAAEAGLVDALRERARPLVSLVAEDGGAVIGHILLSPVALPGHPGLAIMGLAPMAVAAAHRNRGVGSALVRAGLERCREIGCDAVVVLGHPAFYPRFGFVPAAGFGIGCEYDAPADAFMILELRPGALAGAGGTVRYHAAFAAL